MRPFRQRVVAHLRSRAAAYLVLIIAMIPAGVAYWRARENVRARSEARFDVLSAKAEQTIRDTFNDLAADLRAVGGFIEASDSVNRSEWDVFIAKLELSRRHPGIRSIGFAERVDTAERAAFMKRMRGSIGPEYTIFPQTQEPFSFPTVFVTQLPTNIDARLGWDSYSEPLRKEALNTVVATGRPAVTAKASYWNPDKRHTDGFTMFAPIYRRDGNADVPRKLHGVVFSSFIPQQMFQAFSNRELSGVVSMELFDGPYPAPGAFLGGTGTVSNRTPMLHKLVPVRLIDHIFLLRVSTLPEFEASSEQQLPVAVGACGVAFSFLLFGIAWVQGNARSAAERLNRHLCESQQQLRAANAELEKRIAEARAVEGMLAQERDLLRMLLDHSPDGIYFKDLDSRFIRCGKSVLRHLRSNADEITGKSDFDFFTEEHARATRAVEQEIIRTGQPVTRLVEKELWPDGTETWVLTSKMPFRDKQGNIIGTFGMSKDITELKIAELALAQEKELLAVTLRSIGDAVIATDVEGRIVLFNRVAELITGWSQAEAAGRSLTDVFQTKNGDTQLFRRALHETALQSAHDAVLVTRDGSERNISKSLASIVGVEGQKLGAVLVFRDVTEKLKIEAELARASKLESIGVLAGGIAHDFNNILTVILGNISLARMSAAAGLPSSEPLQEAENASLRARELTQRLLTFAKGGAPIKKPLDLSNVVRASAQALLETGVTSEFFISDGLWPVEADEAQISQVLQNLIRHARASMRDNPRLDIHVLNQEITTDPLLLLEPGHYVRISIRDYGAGIQQENLAKIFDPYFDAKKHGSGLDLATAYSIVRKHGGQIRVESISGQGTVFHVYLPTANLAGHAQRSTAPISERAGRMPLHVLVMDDELPIRKLAEHILQHLGCTVETAADGMEAVARYDAALQRRERFDVVIMDLTVPHGMGGKESIRQLKEIDPDVIAIVSSGYSNDPVMANFRDFGFAGVVPKPYTKEDLATALAEVCDPVSRSEH